MTRRAAIYARFSSDLQTPEGTGHRLRGEGKLDALMGGGKFPAMGLGVRW